MTTAPQRAPASAATDGRLDAGGGRRTPGTGRRRRRPGRRPATTPVFADGEPVEGGDLRVVYSSNPSSLDPVQGGSGGDHVSLYLFYDRLVNFDPTDLEPLPGSGHGVVVTRSADARADAARGRDVPRRHPVRRGGRQGQPRPRA